MMKELFRGFMLSRQAQILFIIGCICWIFAFYLLYQKVTYQPPASPKRIFYAKVIYRAVILSPFISSLVKKVLVNRCYS